MRKILLVEDDPNLGFVIEESLQERGYSVVRCFDGEEARESFLRESFHLCLLDVMLPKKDGFTLASEIRKISSAIPIIFLTAKSLKEDRIEGFKIGGDDYVTKPFSMEELLLRIQAVLKRSRGSSESQLEAQPCRIGDFEFDYSLQTLRRKDVLQKLTHKEAELLKLLCANKNALLERELALKIIWGEDTFFSGRSMDVFVSRLRKYLKADPSIRIVNVHGRGFKLMVAEQPQ